MGDLLVAVVMARRANSELREITNALTEVMRGHR
jgi:hypothetical protein